MGCSRRADQGPTQADHGGVSLRMASGEFECQTCALRESEQAHSRGRNALLHQLLHQTRKAPQARTDTRFVLFEGCKKRMRVPSAPRRLWREVRHVAKVELFCQRQD